MKRKKIITIAGRPGSGKSTASKGVAERLGYEHFSSGDLFRAIGRERGFDVYHTNIAAESQKDIDHLVDQKLRDIGLHQQEVTIDSRLAWHWIPDSFKVFLDLDLGVAAKRILENTDPKRLQHEHVPNDPEEYAKELKKRLDVETTRYKKIYDADPYDMKNYELVIDTAVTSSDEVISRIISAYEAWLSFSS